MQKKIHRFALFWRRWKKPLVAVVAVLALFACAAPAYAATPTELEGEELYATLSTAANEGDVALFAALERAGEKADWGNARQVEFQGNVRILKIEGRDKEQILIRHLDGTLYIVSLPSPVRQEGRAAAAIYEGLEDLTGDKLTFNALLVDAVVDGKTYTFIRLTVMPERQLLDRVFKTSTIFMFFFIMLGMGMNLTLQEFVLVFKKPKGIIAGIILQWIVMPLMALGMAYAFGFYQSYPFIYAGMILICACPGGVTSNLMTYYAKGDLALSVSLTSISTVLALLFTPVILTVFCSNIPNIKVPADLIVQTILLLVLVPLVLGMLIRRKWEKFSKKATPFFSALGVIALVMIIGVGLFTNFEKLADTERYSPLFYVMVVLLSILGMLLALGLAKLFKIGNAQCRAISVEVGCRNSTLAVTLTLLIQDMMGDFFSSMFVTTAIYGITMYITGFLVILTFKRLLPIKAGELPETQTKP